MKFLLLNLGLCALLPAATPPQVQPPAAPKVRLHTFTAGPAAYDGNAFWLESDTGLVLIDALLLKSEARLLAASMKTTGKPLAGIILTHPHLDHFGGIRTVASAFGKVPVYATRATAEGVKPTHEQAMALGWPQAYGDDYDADPYVPDSIVESGATLELAGLRFVVRDYGPIEAVNNSVIHNLDLNALFTGDATVAHGAVYVGEGHSGSALEALPRLARDFSQVTRAYSGHYGPMRLGPLVEQNLEEIRFERGVIGTLLADPASVDEKGELSKEARLQAARTIASHAREDSTYGLSPLSLGQMNVAGLEREMRAERKAKPAPAMRQAIAAGLRPLQFLPGRWAGQITTAPPPPPPTEAGTASTPAPAKPVSVVVTFRVGPGGSYLEGEARFTGFGYRVVMGYDPFQKSYRTVFVDDATGLVDVYEGGFDPAGALVQSNVGPGTYYLMKEDKAFTRLTFTPREGGTWRWMVETSTDAGRTWSKSLVFEAEQRLP